MNNMGIDAEKIINLVHENGSFLITTHVSPDGDALGSALALGFALEKLNKKVSYYVDSSTISKFSFLPGIEKLSSPKMLDEYDVGICLDCSDIHHLYGSNILSRCDRIINIDHHINNKKYGDVNLIKPNFGATGEIIFYLINQLDTKLEYDMAIALYTAIVTDTGNFKYSNTTSQTHFIVSQLLKLPIEAWKINKILFDTYSKPKIQLMGKAINNLEFYLEGKMAVIVITLDDIQETGASPEDMEGIINLGRDISGVEVALLIKEIDTNQFKVGFRSNEYVDVGEIALQLGGGGHIRASGCTMQGEIHGIISMLKKMIEEKL